MTCYLQHDPHQHHHLLRGADGDKDDEYGRGVANASSPMPSVKNQTRPRDCEDVLPAL